MTAILETPIEMTEREVAHQKYRLLKRCVVSTASKFGPTELPELPDGGERLFFTRPGLHTFLRSGEYERRLENHRMVTRLDQESGMYALDIIPLIVEPREKAQEQM
jgi:hypothetical protein